MNVRCNAFQKVLKISELHCRRQMVAEKMKRREQIESKNKGKKATNTKDKLTKTPKKRNAEQFFYLHVSYTIQLISKAVRPGPIICVSSCFDRKKQDAHPTHSINSIFLLLLLLLVFLFDSNAYKHH